MRDTSGKLRFLKLIYYSKLQYSQFDKDGSIIEVEVAKTLNHPNVCKYVYSGKLIANGQQLAYIVYFTHMTFQFQRLNLLNC